ncbi:hypothetical protein [Candidatus Stoquefichus sp. SB1]|uniref:hypothetical protein n=1 Tax=Candidatus Stoquefichus sp. SB1 TaxID=1658109 RepID=UPI00067F64D6|nr:hypothetical protein [Candidatus Stoquefichus sp. SB1]
MAKKFQFDDEDDIPESGYQQPSHIDELENMKMQESSEPVEDTYGYTDEYEDFDEEDSQPMSKKKKKFVWKWWYYLLIALAVLMIAFIVYIFVLSSNDGPVYGKRCEGLVTIPKDLQTAAIDTVKKENSDVQDITIEIACRQVKVDIVYKDKMDTKKAQKIAENAVQTLDKLVGKTKEEGKTYSTLFGKIDNVNQYEVNLFLTSQNSDDFPIYGTKNVQNDEFSYTLASVRDKDSAEKAKETLNDN